MKKLRPFACVLWLLLAGGWHLSHGQLHPAYTKSDFLPGEKKISPIAMDFMPNGDLVVVDWRHENGTYSDVLRFDTPRSSRFTN